MIKLMSTGVKSSPRAYAKEMIAGAVEHVRNATVTDAEMTKRESSLVEVQLAKICDRILKNLRKAEAADVSSEENDTEE